MDGCIDRHTLFIFSLLGKFSLEQNYRFARGGEL